MNLQWCHYLYHPIYFVVTTCSDLLLKISMQKKRKKKKGNNNSNFIQILSKYLRREGILRGKKRQPEDFRLLNSLCRIIQRAFWPWSFRLFLPLFLVTATMKHETSCGHLELRHLYNVLVPTPRISCWIQESRKAEVCFMMGASHVSSGFHS